LGTQGEASFLGRLVQMGTQGQRVTWATQGSRGMRGSLDSMGHWASRGQRADLGRWESRAEWVSRVVGEESGEAGEACRVPMVVLDYLVSTGGRE